MTSHPNVRNIMLDIDGTSSGRTLLQPSSTMSLTIFAQAATAPSTANHLANGTLL